MTEFDYLVIGGGSGGVSSAKRAAGYGANVAVCEFQRWGGTCVNVGCVPKKMLWWCNTVGSIIRESHHYGYDQPIGPVLPDWKKMYAALDRSVTRLNGIYSSGLDNAGITRFNEFASLEAQQTDGLIRVNVGGKSMTAKHVCIAVGGTPSKLGIPGEAENTITSDQFFSLPERPKSVAVIGAGYIAVELCQMLQGLGVPSSLFFRRQSVLRSFDEYIQTKLMAFMEKDGISIYPNTTPKEIRRKVDGIYIVNQDDKETGPFEQVLVAIGREPLIKNLGLEKIGVETTPKKYIKVNEYQDTTVPGVHALGDVTGPIELTPVAIAAGRRLADRLFGQIRDAQADYKDVPTVVFSHPPIGTIGLTETEAAAQFGAENIQIYINVSVNLYYNAFAIESTDKPKIYMKLICNKTDNERVVGLHCIGMGCDELLQGFGLGFKLGATKKDFDRVVAIHPSAAEEMVTMVPWGMTKDEMDATIAKVKKQ